ncbi:uncharacterized protein [Euphorbia lathyris]|uniref:uncharacterized protein n=1 Tax=Euphorbia lathyris TaxID=212925 RepID=UPI0033131E0F
MVLVKVYLHFMGTWILHPHLDYVNGDFIIKDKFDPDFLNINDLKQLYRDDLKFHNVCELLCLEPGKLLKSRRVFVLDGDASIRRLLECISKKNNVVHIYASHKVDEPIFATDILPLPYKEMDGVGEDEGARGIGDDGNVGEEDIVENVEVQGDEAANVDGDDRVDVEGDDRVEVEGDDRVEADVVNRNIEFDSGLEADVVNRNGEFDGLEVEVQGEDAEVGKNVEFDSGLEADVVNRNGEFDGVEVEVQGEDAEAGKNVEFDSGLEADVVNRNGEFDGVEVEVQGEDAEAGKNVEGGGTMDGGLEGNIDGGGHVEDCTVDEGVHVDIGENVEEEGNVDGNVEEEDGEDDSEDEDYEVSEGDDDVGSDDDTDVNDEEEALEQIQEARKRERYNLEKGRPYFRIGMTFRGIEEAKHAINDYAVTGGYDIRIMKSDKSRIRVRCFECPFHLFISQDRGVLQWL